MLAGFEGLYEESLPALLMDVDSIEGKLPRRDERDSDETDEMTIANVLWGTVDLSQVTKKASLTLSSWRASDTHKVPRYPRRCWATWPRREEYRAHTRPTGVRDHTRFRALPSGYPKSQLECSAVLNRSLRRSRVKRDRLAF